MENKAKIRPPSAAGQFYPEDKKELEEELNRLMAGSPASRTNGEVFGLLLPHAGYAFSGEVAALGIKAVEGRKFDAVIILADSHYEYFEGVSVWPEGEWETPLGKIKVDKEIAGKIISFSERFISRQSAHLFDHTIEVHLPLLQKALGRFKLVPIVIGSEERDWKKLAEAILGIIKGRKVLIIASSDLSHYPPYEEAKKADQTTLRAIESLDTEILDKNIAEMEKMNIPNAQTFLCSRDSVKALMEIARNFEGKARVLGYANSGDLGGGKSQVVGYGSVAFFKEGGLALKEKEELADIAKPRWRALSGVNRLISS
jgi:MEMO1 family protein